MTDHPKIAPDGATLSESGMIRHGREGTCFRPYRTGISRYELRTADMRCVIRGRGPSCVALVDGEYVGSLDQRNPKRFRFERTAIAAAIKVAYGIGGKP